LAEMASEKKRDVKMQYVRENGRPLKVQNINFGPEFYDEQQLRQGEWVSFQLLSQVDLPGQPAMIVRPQPVSAPQKVLLAHCAKDIQKAKSRRNSVGLI